MTSVITANQLGTLKMLLQAVAHHYGVDGSTKISEAVAKVQTAGISIMSIISVLLPIILGLFSGQPFNLQAVIDAILALLNPVGK